MAGSSLEVGGNPLTWLQPETIEDSRSRTSDLKLPTEGLWGARPPSSPTQGAVPSPRSSNLCHLPALPLTGRT